MNGVIEFVDHRIGDVVTHVNSEFDKVNDKMDKIIDLIEDGKMDKDVEMTVDNVGEMMEVVSVMMKKVSETVDKVSEMDPVAVILESAGVGPKLNLEIPV